MVADNNQENEITRLVVDNDRKLFLQVIFYFILFFFLYKYIII